MAGYFWASIAMIAATRFGKNWIVDTEGATGKAVFPRLVGWSDDDVIDVTDFMSTETVTGYGNIIRIPAHADFPGGLGLGSGSRRRVNPFKFGICKPLAG